MDQGRTPPSDVLAEMPALSGQVHPESATKRSLLASLSPVVDRIRQIRTDLGLSPYRVFLVHWRWPGKRGLGRPVETARVEITPTPKISDMNGVAFAVASFGTTEGGGLYVSKISQRYSEEDLIGTTPDMMDPARPQTSLFNMEFFWEIQLRNHSSKARRYIPAGVPMFDRSGLHWHLNLTKQSTSFQVDAELAS